MSKFRAPSRRSFLAVGAAGAGAVLLSHGVPTDAAEPPPETTRIRLLLDQNLPVLCWAPQYLAMELLQMEGFEQIETVPFATGTSDAMMLAEDRVDVTFPLAMDVAVAVDRGAELTVLGGLHLGCIEIFSSDRVQSINHLRGARMVATHVGGDAHSFLSAVLTYVGLDPRGDVEWVFEKDWSKWPQMLERGDIDVLRLFPPVTYDIAENGIGNLILNTTTDAPWRNLQCCMIEARSEFVRRYPVAAKRALRAYVKAQQACANDPGGSARRLVEPGATDRPDYARRVLDEVPYGAWREYDPASALRFYALRLREAGLIRISPAEIIRRCTDFTMIDQLRREMNL